MKSIDQNLQRRVWQPDSRHNAGKKRNPSGIDLGFGYQFIDTDPLRSVTARKV